MKAGIRLKAIEERLRYKKWRIPKKDGSIRERSIYFNLKSVN